MKKPQARYGGVLPGQHIYAYCNVMTNQVLYSLTRTLQHRQLKQLADTGANNNPPKLRRDVWRPLWSLQLPETPDGVAQGLHAYKLLRDFRQLHETSWEPPKSMSTPYTAKQIEKLEKHLEQRGGSKKETPYDLIARKKWKMRVRMVMNQKANSIADLAAVLLHQESMIEEQADLWKRARAAEIVEMEKLARQWVGPARGELEKQIEEWTAQRDARQKDRRWRKLNGKIDAGMLQLGKMEFAAECVPRAKQEAEQAIAARGVEEERIRVEKENAAATETTSSGSAPALESAAGSSASAPTTTLEETATKETATEEATPAAEEPEPIVWTNFLPSFPPELVRAPLSASKLFINPKETPKRKLPPVYSPSGEGITVRWANTLDAEYAAEWPALVRHQPMGIVRNVAPRADDEHPIFEVAEFKGRQRKSGEKNSALEPSLSEKVLARRAEMDMEERATPKEKLPTRSRASKAEMLEKAPVVEEEAGETEPVGPAVVKKPSRQQQLQRLQTATLESVAARPPKDTQGIDAALIGDAAVAPEIRA